MTNAEWNQAELEQQEQEELRKPSMVYCDYIIDKCHKALRLVEGTDIVMCVASVRHDVENDKLVSHTKQFVLMDVNKQIYRVTVEAA
jgi:hypothetical protein